MLIILQIIYKKICFKKTKHKFNSNSCGRVMKAAALAVVGVKFSSASRRINQCDISHCQATPPTQRAITN